jgi:alpha-galactosidase
MQLRAWTAAQRQMGFEMDPRELTDAEAAELSRVTAWWKANRDWLMAAEIHRLPSDPALIAEQHLAPGGDRFTAFAAQVATPEAITPAPLCLTALDPQATYRVEHLTRADLPALSRGAPALKAGPLDLPGAWLMAHGLPLPWAFPQFMHVIEGRRL